MMYTPSPATRRPRPPGSIPRTREKSSPAALPTNSSHDETPLSAHRRKRQIPSRSALARINASPGDVGDVSLELDPNSDEEREIQQPKTRSSRIGLGLPSALSLPITNTAKFIEPAQPSPPPPYGTELPRPSQIASTPPSQDSEIPVLSIPPSPAQSTRSISSAGEVEERSRVRRATDAARAMGLDMDFGSEDGDGESVGSEGSLSDGAVRHRLREMKRQLRRRDNELLMAARVAEQALRTHEQVIASLSPRAQSHIPNFMSLMSSTTSQDIHPIEPSPSKNDYIRPSRTSIISSPGPSRVMPSAHQSRYTDTAESYQILSSPLHIPSPMTTSPPQRSSSSSLSRSDTNRLIRPVLKSSHSASSPSTSKRHLAILQAESEERVANLETALSEARESEEVQRKLAARLRRDFDKLKRDFERAEERFAGVEEDDRCVSRQREEVRYKRSQGSSTRLGERLRGRLEVEVEENEERVGWGATAFPQYPVSTSRAIPTKPQGHRQSSEDVDMSRGILTGSTVTVQRKVRNRISKTDLYDTENRYPSPTASPLGPRLRVRSAEATTSATPTRIIKPHSRESTSSTIKSSYPLRTFNSAPSPINTILNSYSSPSSQLSHNYSTLNSRMNTMRQYVSSSLLHNDPTPTLARTLGSELGSQYGDHTYNPPQDDSDDTLHEFARIHQGTASSSSGGSAEEDYTSTSGDNGYSAAAPLPEGISRALSSLAGAFTHGSGGQRLGVGGGGGGERMGERRIRWSDPGERGLEGLSRSVRLVSVKPMSERLHDTPRGTRFRGVEGEMGGRPRYDRSTSSSSTIALAHRRIITPTITAPPESVISLSMSTAVTNVKAGNKAIRVRISKDEEPVTIPGRLVHDVICLIAIILDWMECAFVIVYRVVMDMKYTERSKLGLSERARRKRYYL